MPQLNRKDPSGTAERRKKEGTIKLTKNVKVSSTDVVLVSLQRRVQLQTPELLIVLNSYNCLVQPCPTRVPVEGVVRPSLGFCWSKSILRTDNLSLF